MWIFWYFSSHHFPALLYKHRLIFLSIMSPNLSLHQVSFLSFFYAFSIMHVNYTLQKKSVKFQWEWFLSVTSVVPLPQCSTGGQDMGHKFKDGGDGGTCYTSLPCAVPPMSGYVALYSWIHYDRWTTSVTNHPRPALWGQELLPLLSMFWNNTNGHAYTPYNSFKQSVQSKSPLVYRTEFHNLILSLIFWWTSRKFSSKCLLTFVLHVRWVAVIRVIRPGSGWPDLQGASSTCLGTSSPAGFSLPWQP